MADGRRPGGLTALAVLNFVFGGLGAIAVLILSALLGAGTALTRANGEKLEINTSAIYLGMLLGTISAALLITSGVGYIKQKRVLGRYFGDAYALVSLTSTAVNLFAIKNGFGIGTIIGIIYPVLTLILVNTTFKDDLVN